MAALTRRVCRRIVDALPPPLAASAEV